MAKTERDRFWAGVFCGAFCGCFFVTMLLVYLFQVRGFNIAINPNEFAKIAQDKVQDAAAQNLPLLLDDLKADLPGEIDRQLDGLANLNFPLGDSQIQLPPEMSRNLRKELNSLLQVAVNNALNRYDGAEYERSLGRHAYQLVYDLLNREVIGKTYLFRTNQWFRIPVKIVGSSNVKLRWRI